MRALARNGHALPVLTKLNPLTIERTGANLT